MKGLVISCVSSLKAMGISLIVYFGSCVVNTTLTVIAITALIQKHFGLFWSLFGITTVIGVAVTSYIIYKVCKFFK